MVSAKRWKVQLEIVLSSYGRCHKLPQCWWPKTTVLIILETGSPRSILLGKATLSLEALGENPSWCFLVSGGHEYSLACSNTPPVPAFTLTWPSPLYKNSLCSSIRTLVMVPRTHSGHQGLSPHLKIHNLVTLAKHL